MTLTAQATEWTYNSADSTITDGQWTIIVGKNFKTTKTLTMSQRLVDRKWISAISDWKEPSEDTTLSGVLDLRHPLIVKETDGTETTIESVEIGQSALSGTASISYSISELYCDIISKLGGDSCFALNTGLTTVEIGGTAENLPGLLFNKCTALKTLKFNFPNARRAGNSVGHAVIANHQSLDPIDVSTIVTPGITNIYKSAFSNSKLYGDIALTNIMVIGESAFQGASLTNVYLSGSLTTLPSQAFRGNNSITNVVLDLPDLETIDILAFGHGNNNTMQQGKIRRVEFVSALSDMGQVTNIVRWVDNSNVGDLRIYVSKKQWTEEERANVIYNAETNPTGFFAAKDTLTDKEKESIDAETLTKVIGVLVKGGVRKGIFVHKTSIHDPLGLFIRIR